MSGVLKFMTKSMRMTGNKSEVYSINSEEKGKIGKPEQDTDKIKYILCDDCEKYFGLLETYIAARLHNRIADERFKKQFKLKESSLGEQYLLCNEINPMMLRLLIYSIMWRSSISHTFTCRDFKLDSNNEEDLRTYLIEYRHTTQSELLECLKNDLISRQLFPFALSIALHCKDFANNLLFIYPTNKNSYLIFINNYLLNFSFTDLPKNYSFNEIGNMNLNDCKIAIISEQDWSIKLIIIRDIYAYLSSVN